MLALVTDAYGGRGGIAQYNRDLFGALSEMTEAIEILPRHAAPAGQPPANVRQLRAPREERATSARRCSRRSRAGRT